VTEKTLSRTIESLWARRESEQHGETRAAVNDLLDRLENGSVRAAEPNEAGGWDVNVWVKQGILLAFRSAQTMAMGSVSFASFHDREMLKPRQLTTKDAVRMVPGGSALRRGAYVGPAVTIMPPAYVNIGAYVDEATMIDSHVLVGSCAQIGKRVHLSAACQIGGVLEPIGARPVIIEDDVLVGGNCGMYEGVLVRKRAVIGAGLTVTASTPIYDLVNGCVLRSAQDEPLEIPEGAVVVPGARAITQSFGHRTGLSLSCGVIVKYRDDATETRIALEGLLREPRE
jgi:2,3,4,5-tetrahydropyridine-2-carboxylate N-succinyltransferase